MKSVNPGQAITVHGSGTQSQLQLPQDRVPQARELHGVCRGAQGRRGRQNPVLPQVHDQGPGHLRVRGTSTVPSDMIQIRGVQMASRIIQTPIILFRTSQKTFFDDGSRDKAESV